MTIKGASLTLEQIPKLDQWFRTLLWDSKVPGASQEDGQDVVDEAAKFEIYRVKARLLMADGTVKIVQGVRDVFEIRDSDEKTGEGQEREGETKLVIIGRDLGPLDLEKSYRSSVEA